MDQDIVKDARARVANLLGQTVAEKASEAFCLAFGQPVMAMAAGFESVAESPRAQSVVLELTPQPEISAEVNRAIEAVRASRGWSSVLNALRNAQITATTSGVVTEVMESGRSEPDVLPVYAAQLLRHAKIMSVRDNFLKIAGPITDEIERGGSGFARGFAEAAAPQPSASLTQVCWLNRTLRSRADPRTLAEIAVDDSVERIDLPRRLQREVNVSARTVGAPQFRKRFKKTGKGIIVAVIDSEVALTHPALKGRVVHKQNFTNEPWGRPDSHGTAVAGIIASGDTRFSGMAPEATIYNYKILATNDLLTGDDFDGALAIQQALEDGAHIANCSWGAGPAGDGTSREAVACNEAWALGLVIVKSAGNRGPGARTLTTPADADGIIAVGATDRAGAAVQNYSSRGPAGAKQRPHLIAPGGILGGVGITSCLKGGGFGDVGAGTSFAAPHVSGLLALLLERNPNLTPDAARDLLLNACTPLAGIDVNTQGNGLVSIAGVP